jgi:hypothetical protein
MFERRPNPEQAKRMVLASAVSWRQRQAAVPVGSLLGWDVWVMDGKAYLFRDGRDYCLVADWFEFCRAIDWMFHGRGRLCG